jgi:hypothetical protein
MDFTMTSPSLVCTTANSNSIEEHAIQAKPTKYKSGTTSPLIATLKCIFKNINNQVN